MGKFRLKIAFLRPLWGAEVHYDSGKCFCGISGVGKTPEEAIQECMKIIRQEDSSSYPEKDAICANRKTIKESFDKLVTQANRNYAVYFTFSEES